MRLGVHGSARAWPALASAAIALSTRSLVAAPVSEWPPLIPEWFLRSSGGGLALVPLIFWGLWVGAWIATSDWITRDSTLQQMRPNLWGAVTTFPFFFSALVAWWIPSIVVGQFLMLLAWLSPVVAYTVLRNRKVVESQRLLTVEHGRRIVADLLRPFGIEIATPMSDAELLPRIALQAAGGKTPQENSERLAKAAATAGFDEARKLMLTAVTNRAATVMLTAQPEGFSIRHEVDGVWHPPQIRKAPANAKEKETWIDAAAPIQPVGEAIQLSLKVLAGLDPGKQPRQAGTFALQVDGKLRNCQLVSQLVLTGAQVVVRIESSHLVFQAPSDLGMSSTLADRVTELLTLEKGLLVLSAPASSGLTSTFDVVVGLTDRLVRDFISVEDAAIPSREIQNVKPARFDARTGVTAISALQLALREYPRGIITRDLRDAALALELATLANQKQLVIISIKAPDSIAAITKLIDCGIPASLLARTLLGSLSQRLVRKLCPRCREEYPTPLELLLKFKRTAEQLPTLRRASPQGCRLCVGTGYFGRTAIFELASGVAVKEAISKKSEPQILRQAAIKDGMQSLQNNGLLLAIKGDTTLEEMQRVFSKS